MNALTPSIAIDPAHIGAGIWPVPDAPSEQSARQSVAYARQCQSRAQKDYDEAAAALETAEAIRDPFQRQDAVMRASLALKRCASVLAGILDRVRQAEAALAECEGANQ